MDYKILPITTKRLLLRPVELSDKEDMYRYASRPENVKYVTFDPHESLEETEETIKTVFLTKPDKRMPETWAIVYKENNQMIGTIDFHQINKRTHEAEVGYILNQDYWNQGLMTEALKAVLDFGFKVFQFNEIIAKCHPLNYGSAKVMIKCGMEYSHTEQDVYGQITHLVYSKQAKRRSKNETRKKI